MIRHRDWFSLLCRSLAQIELRYNQFYSTLFLRLFGTFNHCTETDRCVAMASCEEAPKKRKGFVFKPIQKPERQTKAPRFDQLVFGPAPPLQASPAVRAMFGHEGLIVGVDVETHALVPPQPKGIWHAGNFGLQTKLDLDSITPLRIVQIGWVFGELSTDTPESKSRFVKPDGFHVDPDASAKHGISHERALAEGLPPDD